MDIRKLLEGTKYADKADSIATIIERANLNNEAAIHNLPRLGHFAGVDVYALLRTILEQAETETAVKEVGNNEATPPKKTKPTPRKRKTAITKTDSGRKKLA